MERPWDVKQLAAETGIPAATWRYYEHRGTGPRSFKIGGRRFWRPSDVEKWLDEQYRESGRVSA